MIKEREREREREREITNYNKITKTRGTFWNILVEWTHEERNSLFNVYLLYPNFR
jgi:hypothetical protein